MSYHNGPRIVSNGLVLYLDAGSTKSYPGSGTAWTDLSGNNNNGTLVNGPSYSSSNKGGIVFDGVNDYVQLSSSTQISDARNNGFTIGAWIYMTSNSSIMGVCGVADNGSTGSNAINLRVNASSSNALQAGSIRLAVSNSSATLKILSGATNSNNISINRWNYIVASSYPINNVITIYSNGVSFPISYASQQAPDIFSNFVQPFYIGSLNGGGVLQQPFLGRISNFSFYNKILLPNEVLQNYNATKGRYNL